MRLEVHPNKKGQITLRYGTITVKVSPSRALQIILEYFSYGEEAAHQQKVIDVAVPVSPPEQVERVTYGNEELPWNE